jgi:hypothetical protein
MMDAHNRLVAREVARQSPHYSKWLAKAVEDAERAQWPNAVPDEQGER